MMKTGLVSVSFRQLSPGEIIALTAKAGLDGIEWGGDIHVPHGDLKRAAEVGKMTEQAGLNIAAYGSYYRVGTDQAESGIFEQVLETALVLGAHSVRVWAGNRGSQAADGKWREAVVSDSRRIAELAEKEGIKVCYEYHGNTLTDTEDSALRLLQEVDHSNMLTLWQPPIHRSFEERLSGLRSISKWLFNVHVYHWLVHDRRPLAEGREEWKEYLAAVEKLPGEHYAMLEFVKNDDPGQFLQDALTLQTLVNAAAGKSN
jgi:3-dehydroshikimate dehydratase